MDAARDIAGHGREAVKLFLALQPGPRENERVPRSDLYLSAQLQDRGAPGSIGGAIFFVL